MIRFTLDKQAGEYHASGLVQGFPTLDSFRSPFEGCNIRAPEADGDGEWEDIEEQDEVMAACGMKLKGMIDSRQFGTQAVPLV